MRMPRVLLASMLAVAAIRGAIAEQSACDFVDGETVTTVPHGWSGFGPGKQWCNRCSCREGRLGCLTLKLCPPPQNCTLSDDRTTVQHGWKGHNVAFSWCNECSCSNGDLNCTDMTCGPANPSTCILRNGTHVENGWSGKDTGSNYCNNCRCSDGHLACTMMACPPTSQEGCTLRDGTHVPAAWAGSDTGDNWCNSCRCLKGALACTLKACPKTAPTVQESGGCELADGAHVEEGWSGKGIGRNSCNTCRCSKGRLACTMMACPPQKETLLL